MYRSYSCGKPSSGLKQTSAIKVGITINTCIRLQNLNMHVYSKKGSRPQKPPYIKSCHRSHSLRIASITLLKQQRDLRACVLWVHQLLRLRKTRIAVQQAAQVHARHGRAEDLEQHFGGLDRAVFGEEVVFASLVR
jgi:hypothetical protein